MIDLGAMLGMLEETIASPELRRVVLVGGLFVAAWLVGLLGRLFLHRVVRAATRHTAWRWDDALYEFGAFRWMARMLPAIVVYYGIGVLLHREDDGIATFVRNLAVCWIIVCVIAAMGRALLAFESLYSATPAGKRSIKGVVQLLQLALWIVALVLVITKLTHQSIGLLLSGIGAMSAVLLLVFKDTILGFVAGIQLSTNDMLRVGDWITMASAGVDGDVIDITLHTVKVRNFDRTIVTVPTWKLISESFQNWRGMSESGGRRIKRELYIDAACIRFLEDDEIEAFGNVHLLKAYLARKRDDIRRWNEALGEAGKLPVNRRRQTNIGAFRAYAEAYLAAHPDVHDAMTRMVRMRDPGPQGVPLEIYCFTNTVVWLEYERIQADIFDHLIAILPAFGLRPFQQPSGGDVRDGVGALRQSIAEVA
ncbi:mechanosensitive ion channel domain-containing protein [Luteibacter sp. 3190]|uniref:mechanosensitive ion channel family protein n=1 Tax=Luteibacter sp. 3190 TaxID=2817736 RepID=UPI00285BD1CF|nr:mechanosensitive ion channel domain-containing protein [Luteibacter sp. 3190]MDR6937241.1 miniconductance mechanosensitive channel [Luteibacter sp. 3190]